MYCKVVSEVGPAPGWSQKCTRMAGDELQKLAYWLFSAIGLGCFKNQLVKIQGKPTRNPCVLVIATVNAP